MKKKLIVFVPDDKVKLIRELANAIGDDVKIINEQYCKFKVGDHIRPIKDDCGIGDQVITKIHRDGYLTAEMLKIKFKKQDQWELVGQIV